MELQEKNNEVELAALAYIADTYSTCIAVADADEILTTNQLLARVFLTFGEHCTSYYNLNTFMQAEGYMLTSIDTEAPRWLLKLK